VACQQVPGALVRRLADSPRWRVLRMMWETSPALMLVMGLFVLADGFLPILALVGLGQAVGRIPKAVAHGLGSPSGPSLLLALAIGTAAYALSLLRSPAQSLGMLRTGSVPSTWPTRSSSSRAGGSRSRASIRR
jgi:hypothetical protein